MHVSDWDEILDVATSAARGYLSTLPHRRVYPDTTPAEIRAIVDRPLPDIGTPAAEVVTDLARDLEPFVTAHASGRYFGFVIGGLHPAAYGAELLVSTWDQNAGLYAPTPGCDRRGGGGQVDRRAHRAARGQLRRVRHRRADRQLHLPGRRSRPRPARAGWDVEADGLPGAPRLTVVVKTGCHSTIPRALRYLGLGERTATEVASDDQDRYLLDELRATLEAIDGPTIVCAEAGNVNTGAFDRFDAIADLVDAHRARGNPTWVHVDGAVGLLAAPRRNTRTSWSAWTGSTRGPPTATSSSTSPTTAASRSAGTRPHRAAMSVRASYLVQGHGEVREAMDYNPEFSRRARATGVYATLRSLGRDGVSAW
jgi:glutamate/tyrosine decarboxylase-like PLP-dependent enzyme